MELFYTIAAITCMFSGAYFAIKKDVGMTIFMLYVSWLNVYYATTI